MRIPCIGVCRGAELIFTYLGGKLVPANKNIHAGKSHKVFLSDTAPAFFTRAMLVNSFHKWAIPLGSAAKIIPFAISEDGLIEAFYHNKMLLMGIMWHPERKFDRSSERKMHSHNFYSNIIKFFKNRRRS